jgi:hypothetical protein
VHVVVLEMRLGHAHVKGYEDLQKHTLRFRNVHVDASTLKRHASLIQDKIALALVDECCVLLDLVRYLAREILRHKVSNGCFIEKLIAKDQTLCSISFAGKLFLEPSDLDDGGLSAPGFALERCPLADFFAMRFHKEDFLCGKAPSRFEFATLGIRLDQSLMILVFELELLANLEAIRQRACDGLGSSLGSRMLDLAHNTNGTNGRTIQVTFERKVSVQLMQL